MTKIITKYSNYFLILFLATSLNFNLIKTDNTHIAHLSSEWYPQKEIALEQNLNFHIKKAKENFKVNTDSNQVKVLITPHAGYYYSGLCAATAFQTLLENNKKNTKIKNVIILAPSHTKNFNGIAIPNFENYKTSLGNIKIDKAKLKKLKINKNFKISEEHTQPSPKALAGTAGVETFNIIENTFNKEHAIEIQLPFLQHTVENFELIPLIVGNIQEKDFANYANTIKNIIDDQTLIVISSDFIHYGPNYNYTPFDSFILDNIKYTDTQALYAIGQQSFKDFSKTIQKTGATICGQNCIKILLKLLEDKPFGNIEPRLTCYYTSAQLSQARNKNNINIQKLLSDLPDNLVKNSVSYAGLIFTTEKNDSLKKEDQLTEYEKKSLSNLAQRSIENELSENKRPPELLYPVRTLGLDRKSGAFVTLEKNGQLRGCIGRIIANQELYKTVEEMARAAAFNDSRFTSVKKDELNNLDISISILTQPKNINNYSEIVLGKHGIILKKQTKSGYWTSAVFLPKVPTDLGWNLQTTLEHLSAKAGLDKNAWQQDCKFEIFESFEIKKKTKYEKI